MKRSGFIRKRSFKQSAIQVAYKQANERCELTPWFKRHFREWPITMEQLDVHHIRKPGRKDCWSNMIRVCRSIHSFDDQHPNEMAVVSLWHKLRKGGMDWNMKELDLCGVGTVAGWIDRIEPKIDVFLPLWRELIEAAS